MCGRYSVLTEDEIIEVREIIKTVALRLARDEFEDYEEPQQQEVFPTNRSPVVTSDGEELAFEHAQFGFERWEGKGVIINVRSETIGEKTMFRNRIDKGRCVIPASGYYEWKSQDEGKKKKIKHLIKDKDKNLLFMAGLWRDGNAGREFAIITKDPVGEVSDIHDRMPVLLRTDQLEAWLSGAMPIDELASMDYYCYGTPYEGTNTTEAGNGEQIRLF